MSGKLRVIFSFSLSCTLICGVLTADPVDDIDAYMQAVVRVQEFSGSVLVAQNGSTILSRGYGLASIEHAVANTPQTKFRIGSITKQFTSMAIMMLSDRGKLDIADPIGKYLSNTPEAWGDVTIHHLLTHTSGIPSYTSLPEYRDKMMLEQNQEQMVARFRDLPLEFDPGQEHRYSNSGYFLLGMIIEDVSGTTYDEFLRNEIWSPLQMQDTGYEHQRVVLKHRASGYARRSDGPIRARYLDMTQPYSAGSLYSTVEDLNRWDQALRRRELISADSYKRMYTPEKDNYAYGWHVGESHGRSAISHGGGINGFSSFILRIPDETLCVVVLSNIQQASSGRIAHDLAAIILGETYEIPQQPKLITVDASIFDSYVGDYVLRPELVLTISRDRDWLMAKLGGEPAMRLEPTSKTEYLEKITGAKLTFLQNETGDTEAILLRQGGREIRGQRREIAPAQ